MMERNQPSEGRTPDNIRFHKDLIAPAVWNVLTMDKEPSRKKCVACIPSDIMERIFLRLPLGSLQRCRGVCKRWRSIIRDPQFIDMHLQLASRCTLLFFPRERICGRLYPSDAALFEKDLSPSAWASPAIEPDDFLCGSCNGLLCFYTKTSTIKIVNFSTGECLHIVKPGKNIRADNSSLYVFGFHPVSKEYKVIHLLRERRSNTEGSFHVIHVYTLGDENWRDVRAPSSLWLPSLGVVLVDGAMYWLVEDWGTSWLHTIMSFDLKEESFATIQPPGVNLNEIDPRCTISGPRWFHMTEMDGKVCLTTAQNNVYTNRGVIGKLQIWTLECKKEQRWSKKYNIELPPRHVPGPYFIHGDKIMMHSNDDMYYHELPAEDFKIHPNDLVKLLHFTPRWRHNMRSFAYVKSIVQLDAYKGARIVRTPKRRNGWDLKRWELWESELNRLDELWNNVNQLENYALEMARSLDMNVNQLLLQPLDQKTRSLRRRSWVERARDEELLKARLDRIKVILQDLKDAAKPGGDGPSKLTITLPDQGNSSATSSTASQGTSNSAASDGNSGPSEL